MSIPIPNAPTDNLYKFLATGGLLLVMLFFWLAKQSWTEGRIALNDYLQATIAMYDNEYFVHKFSEEQDTDTKRPTQDEWMAGLEDMLKGYELDFDSVVTEEEFSALDDVGRRKLDLKVKGITKEYLRDMQIARSYLTIIRNARSEMKFYFLMAFTSIGISGLGFILWYRRSQRYLDAQLIRQAAE